MQTLKTFLSYSHEDKRLRKKLRNHFAPLRHQGLVSWWDDGGLQVGEHIDSVTRAALERTDVFLLLVSPEFLSSEYCWGVEMKHALERHRAGTALVLPVITKPCYWKESPLGELLVAPTDGRPISSWSPRDAGWADATRLMLQAIIAFRGKRFGREPIPLNHPPPPLPPGELTEPFGIELDLVKIAGSPSPPRPPPEKTRLFEPSLPPPLPGAKRRGPVIAPPAVRRPTVREQVHGAASRTGTGDAPGAPMVQVDASLLPTLTSFEVTEPEGHISLPRSPPPDGAA